MISRLVKPAELSRVLLRASVFRTFAATQARTNLTTTRDAEEETVVSQASKIRTNLGIVDQHVSALRENLNTGWIVKLDYDTKIKPVLAKYKELGLTSEDINTLARKWPEGLVFNNNPEKKMDIFELAAHLASKYGVKDSDMLREMVITTPEYMMTSRAGFDERVERLRKSLQLDEVILS